MRSWLPADKESQLPLLPHSTYNGCSLVPCLFLAPTSLGAGYSESQSSTAPTLTPEEGAYGRSMEALAALPRHGFPGPGWQGPQKAGLGPCVYLLVALGPWGQRAGTPRGPTRSSVCSAPPRPWQCHSRRCRGTLETASRHGCWPPGGPQVWGRVSGRRVDSQQ